MDTLKKLFPGSFGMKDVAKLIITKLALQNSGTKLPVGSTYCFLPPAAQKFMLF